MLQLNEYGLIQNTQYHSTYWLPVRDCLQDLPSKDAKIYGWSSPLCKNGLVRVYYYLCVSFCILYL